jgi:hypothetical protein
MAEDLFVYLDSLWNKERPEGSPPIFVMHRFLASDRMFAPYARVLQRDISDSKMSAHTWRGMLPMSRKAPRLAYGAPKKKPAAEALVARMMEVRKVRREQAEAELDMVESVGRLLDLYVEHGVEPPAGLLTGGGKKKATKPKAKKQPTQEPASGLLGLVKG